LLVADEPTTSLDATVQAAFLAHLREIQRDTGVAILFITHDFAAVSRICDRVAVMYGGRIVETAPLAALLETPRHPYTQALLQAVLDVDDSSEVRRDAIPGQPPTIYDTLPGCRFAPRCAHALARCTAERPPTVVVGGQHVVDCWLHA